MILRVGIGVVLLAVAVVVAVVLERRRNASNRPVRDPYPVPRQVFRGDFPDPALPWLVALFSSNTCDSCAAMRGKVLALASPEVAVCDIEYTASRALHERYEITGVPMVLVADADGVVRRSFVGSVSATDLWAAVAEVRDGERSEPG